jgi:hypothetical protein
MRGLIVPAFVFVSLISHTQVQSRGQIWLGAGIKREVHKDFVLSAGTNARWFNDGSIKTLYQEVCIKSEHLDWLRPSVEYRIVTSYDDLRNYSNAHRLNVNLDFRTKVSDFKIGMRLRYQGYLGGGIGDGSDLDPAYRFKPYAEWKNKSRYTPEISAEYFYNPIPGPVGTRFNRMRYGLTMNIDAKGPNDFGITYYYGRKFNTGKPYTEHILSLEYSFEWKKPKKEKEITE